MAEFKKSDAIDYAHSVKMLVDSLIDEGFTREEAMQILMNSIGGKK